MKKIIIVVEGGLVTDAYCNSEEELDFEILDYDNEKVDAGIKKYNESLLSEINNDENYKKIY